MLLMEKPAEAARLCGLTRLTDTLHGRWIREMVFGQGDMTLLAHRGSYKTTCLSFAMAVMLVVYPRKNLLFLRKTDSDVLEVLRQVKLLLATDAMQELTGRIYGSPVQVLRGDMWSVNTDCYAAIRGAPQLLGLGTGGSMTGKHADIILTDDIVNLQDRISVVERKRICGVYQELQNIRNPGGRILNADFVPPERPWIRTLVTRLSRHSMTHDPAVDIPTALQGAGFDGIATTRLPPALLAVTATRP